MKMFMEEITKLTGLIVEDDECISMLLQESLPEIQFKVCPTLRDAESVLENKQLDFSVILLDLHLPDGESLGLLGLIRNDFRFGQVPVFVLTADQSESPALMALGIGANDYIFKPLKMKLLRAKILQALKNSKNPHQTEINAALERNLHGQIDHRDFVVDFDSLSLTMKQDPTQTRIALTPTEFKILTTLLKNCDQVVSRDTIQSMVWGPQVHLGERTIDQHVAALRKKMGPLAKEMIHTERGAGFRIQS